MPFPTTATDALEQLQIDVSCHTEVDSEEFYESINDIIEQAEFHIWTDSEGMLGFRHETNVNLTPDLESQDIHPAGDYIVITAMKVIGGNGDEDYLLNKNESFIQETNQEADSALPRFYCPTGTETGTVNAILVAPMPDTNYQALIEYSAFDSLISVPAGTWLSTEAYDVLFYATLIDAYSFLKADADYIRELEAEYASAMDDLLFRQAQLMRNTAFKYGKSVIK